jgi:ATP-dependent RNA helicase SUPV3L1/SUV3
VDTVQTEAALAPETSEEEESGGAADPSVAAVEAAEPPVAVVEVEAAGAESSGELDASTEPASLTSDEAKPLTADSPSAETPDEATPQTADSPSAENAEPEFEEIWRFRRPKPKFERPEAQGERRHHRRPSGERGHRPHHDRGRAPNAAPTAAAPAGEQIQPPAERLNDQASAGHREHGQRPNRHNDRPHHKPHDGDRNRDRGRQPAPQAATAKAEGSDQRPAGNAQQRSKPPYQGNRDRPHDRSRDSRPPRQQGGRQPVAASAAPKRASGGVDPDSPFAALGQLKERLEKQLQTQD